MDVLTEQYLTTVEAAHILHTSVSSVRALCEHDGSGDPESPPALVSFRLACNKSGIPGEGEGRYHVTASSVQAYILRSLRGDSNDVIAQVARCLAAMTAEDLGKSLELSKTLRESRRQAAKQLGLMPQPKTHVQASLL